MDDFFFQYVNYQSGHPKLVYAEQYELTLSCYFHLRLFPFDSHKCSIEFGDLYYETRYLNLSTTTIVLRDAPAIMPHDDPTQINNLPYPYEFKLQSLPAFEIEFNGYIMSFTGVLLKLERKSIDYLLSGYYYPTTAFALLSMISYLIDADIVRFEFMKLCCVCTKFKLQFIILID